MEEFIIGSEKGDCPKELYRMREMELYSKIETEIETYINQLYKHYIAYENRHTKNPISISGGVYHFLNNTKIGQKYSVKIYKLFNSHNMQLNNNNLEELANLFKDDVSGWDIHFIMANDFYNIASKKYNQMYNFDVTEEVYMNIARENLIKDTLLHDSIKYNKCKYSHLFS